MIGYIVLAILVVCFGLVVFIGAPYVPTLKKDLRTSFDELHVIRNTDLVLDIGSGDGTVLREVARRGGTAIGYEINPVLVMLSRLLNRGYPQATVKFANGWSIHFPAETTLVYAFVVSRDTARLARKLQTEANRLQKPLLLMSYGALLPSVQPIKQAGAHHLYSFVPLQGKKPQV